MLLPEPSLAPASVHEESEPQLPHGGGGHESLEADGHSAHWADKRVIRVLLNAMTNSLNSDKSSLSRWDKRKLIFCQTTLSHPGIKLIMTLGLLKAGAAKRRLECAFELALSPFYFLSLPGLCLPQVTF